MGKVLGAIVVIVLVVGSIFAIAAVLLAPAGNSAPKGYADFLHDVQAGRVQAVTQEDQSLTVKEDGTTYAVTVPNVLTDAFGDISAAAAKGGTAPPAFTVEKSVDDSWLVVVGLLPILLVMIAGVTIILATLWILVRPRRSGGGPSSLNERLSDLDAAWKAGLISDEERAAKRTEILRAF